MKVSRATTENVDSFLDLTYWEPGIDILFDLQYHPIIYLEKYYMIPLTILANSNAIRNLYASQYKVNNLKILLDGSKDALVDKLSDAFHAAGIENYKQTSVPKTDIDLFAILDDTLFLFECKQSLHPVSIFDLRLFLDSVSVRTLTYNLTDPPILFDAYYLSAEYAEPKLHDFTSQLKRKEDYKKKRKK